MRHLKNPVWSLTVRLTHWLVAVGVLYNMLNDSGYMHRVIGYMCVAIIMLRIIHGVYKNALPSSHFYFPRFSLIKQHIAEIVSGKVTQHDGHNPLGMLAVYFIWLLIVLLALSGWLSRTDAYWGEDGPVLIHQVLSYILQGVVVLHVIAVLVMSKLQKQNLIKQMLTMKSKR